MYDLLLQTSPEPIFIYDIDNLKFLEMNDAALKLYGYSRDEFMQMDLTDLYAPEDIQTLIESSNKQVVENVYNGPYRHRKKDGNSLLVKISKSTIDFNGRRAHFNILKNVTETIEQDRDFHSYQYVFDNSSDYIVFTDIYGFVSTVNKAFTRQFGYRNDEVNKLPFANFVADSDGDKVSAEIFRSGQTIEKVLDVKFRRKNTSTFPSTAKFSPQKNFNGVVEGYIVIIQPEQTVASSPAATPAKSVPAEVHESLDTDFLSHLFHEILTPINVIIGFGQELIDSISNPTAEQLESTQIIQENQKSLLQMMDTAGEYATLLQNKVELEPRNIVFIDIIEELEENTKRAARTKGVEFAYGKISSSLSFTTDKYRIISLLSHFLTYSVGITKNNNIILSAQPYDNANFIVSVKDERGAISQQLTDGLRDVFSQDENIVRQKYGFSRFGVRLIRKLLALLKGRTGLIKKGGQPSEYGIILPTVLAVEKVKAEPVTDGVEFEPSGFDTVSFPQHEIAVPEAPQQVQHTPPQPVPTRIEEPRRQAPPPPPQPVPAPPPEPPPVREEPRPEPVSVPAPQPVMQQPPAQPAYQQKVQQAAQATGVDFSQLTCLYLEDQVDSQILFKVQMKELNKIEVASSFEQAHPILESNSFSFIVMDINLQGEYNGLDALRIIRQMPGYQSIPVIAVTAYVLPGDREKFIAAGFNDFISKPVLKDNLMEVLKKVM